MMGSMDGACLAEAGRAARPRASLTGGPMYRTHVVIPGVLAADECAVLRALEPKLKFRAGTVSLVRAEQPETRRLRVAWLRRDEERFAWVFARIDRVLAAVNAPNWQPVDST